MRTIDDYLDAAMQRQNLKHDSELSRAVGLKRAAVCIWRTKRAWPADETMVRLAELAGIPPAEALLDLNVWRSDGAARACYEKIARAITTTAATVLLTLTISGQVKAEQGGNILTAKGAADIHYATLARLLRTLAAAVRGFSLSEFFRVPSTGLGRLS